MFPELKTVLALSPVLLLVALLLRLPLLKAAPLAFIYTALLAVWGWSLPITHLFSAVAKGALLSFDILLIVFGAILFLSFLKERGTIRHLELQLRALSPDRRIQAILLAWLFGSFIEGSAGFGTPAALVAPLLVSLGFPPLKAILVSLAANSTAVVFGAVGTPIRIGLAGVDTAGVPWRAAVINLLPGLLVPVFILWIVVGGEKKAFKSAIPWALFAGLAFLVPYSLLSLLGPEFPSLLGATVGLGLAVLSLRTGLLVPEEAWRFSGDPDDTERAGSFLSAAFPYGLLLLLLLAGKFLFTSLHLSFGLGGNLSHTIQIFNPGFAFLTAIFLLALSRRGSFRKLKALSLETLPLLFRAATSIFFVASLTQLMVVTAAGSGPGMLELFSTLFQTTALPFFTPIVGAFGSFVAGSATVSNLLFGQALAEAAGAGLAWVLALQCVGAGAGNMIALPNLLAVQATVGTEGREREILGGLILPCILYLAAATGAGVILAGIIG